jgi:uncharacterized membrane protein YjjP (DUF1212 family)
MDLHLPHSLVESLRGYPRWLVVACATVVAACLLWILVKLLRVGFWLLLIVVLAAGTILTLREMLR